MTQFLSCDWGTTAFRLRLIHRGNSQIVEEARSDEGIAATFQQWKQSGLEESARIGFYLSVISRYIKILEDKVSTSLDNVPVIISGMASSTIGMTELSYRQLPVAADVSGLYIHTIQPSENFRHLVIIISGLRTEDDVMRGEETKLMGCAADMPSSGSQLYIFPGTHSKHAEIKDGRITSFKTYMTGEFFELLSKKSILSVSVKADQSVQFMDYLPAFQQGVKDSRHSNLLNNSFRVRTNELFKKLTPEENYHYLSGILIGSELKDLVNDKRNITVLGSAALISQYATALRTLGLPNQGQLLVEKDADEALIQGQILVFNNLG